MNLIWVLLVLPLMSAGEKSVAETKLNENPVYVAELEECLSLINAIPIDLPIKFYVTKIVNDHINILVYDDGKYDYYEHNDIGHPCYTAIRKEENVTRSLEEQNTCVSSPLGDYHAITIDEYGPQLYSCGYEVLKYNDLIVVYILSTDGIYEYEINRTTRKTELYRYNTLSFDERYAFEDTTRLGKCLNKKYLSDFNIPLEITQRLQDQIEISVKYQGNYDLYVTEKFGRVRYMETQIKEKPHFSNYSDKIQCTDIEDDKYHLNLGQSFRCPVKVVENANFVTISVNAFHNENIYVIDKSTNDVTYSQVKNNFILTKLPIPDAKLNQMADMDKCVDHLTSLNKGPFPVGVVRNQDYLQISVKFKGQLKFFETASNGLYFCKNHSEPSTGMHLLEEDNPECVSCDGPAHSFNCPYFDIVEDDNVIQLIFALGGFQTTYTHEKSSGNETVSSTGQYGQTSFIVVLKSLVG